MLCRKFSLQPNGLLFYGTKNRLSQKKKKINKIDREKATDTQPTRNVDQQSAAQIFIQLCNNW